MILVLLYSLKVEMKKEKALGLKTWYVDMWILSLIKI